MKPSHDNDHNQTPELETEDAEARIHQMSRRSFLWSAVAIGGAYGGVRWLNSRPLDDGALWPLRRVLRANETVSQNILGVQRLAPTFAAARIDPMRTNGAIGLESEIDVAQWRLKVVGGAENAEVTLDKIEALPQQEMITQLRCIEGWAIVQRWKGARLSDFIREYPPQGKSGQAVDFDNLATLPNYIGLKTPDEAYYVGLDMASALHPQTLLCYEMNGQPLSAEHGAPLRLAIAVKYGIKNLKRIGTLTYTDERPPDYWAERGYDYYAGH